MLAAFDINVGPAIADVQDALLPVSRDERECLELVDFLREQDIDSSSEEDLDIFLAALDVDLGPALQKVLEVERESQLPDFREWAAAVAAQRKRLSSWHGNIAGSATAFRREFVPFTVTVAIGRASCCPIATLLLFGGATLVAGTRTNDTISMGSGNDTIITNMVLCSGGADAAMCTNDTISMGSGNDTIFGRTEAIGTTMVLCSGGADAAMCTNDTISMGSGNDTIFGRTEAIGTTMVLCSGGADAAMSNPAYGRTDGATLVAGTRTNDTISMGSGNDTIFGRTEAIGTTMVLCSGGADAAMCTNDTISMGSGNDTIFGRTEAIGTTMVLCSGGADAAMSNPAYGRTDGATLVAGTRTNDTISMGSGNDTIFGRTEAIGTTMVLCSGGADAAMSNPAYGRTGVATLVAEAGNDTLLGCKRASIRNNTVLGYIRPARLVAGGAITTVAFFKPLFRFD